MRSRLVRGSLRLSVLELALLLLTISAAAIPSQSAAQSCAADCDGNGRVVVDELVTAMNVALGRSDQDTCPASDPDRDGAVTIEELVNAVARSLSGCFRRQGRDAVEVATRVEETTRNTLPGYLTLNFGSLFAGGGSSFRVARPQSVASVGSRNALAGGGLGQPVPQPCTRGDSRSGTILTTCNRATNTLTTTYAQCRLPGDDVVRNGIEKRTVVVPGNPGFDFCVTDPQVPDSAIVTVVLEEYSAISPSAGIRLANLSQRFEATGPACELEATGGVFPNGTLTTDGFVHTFCDPDTAGCDATLADLRLTARGLELQQTYARPACDLTVQATGELFVDNASTGESFAQTFLGLTIRESVVGDRRTLSQNGRVLVDCLGEVEYSMPADLLIEPDEACPSDGELRIVIRDFAASGALTAASRTRAIGAAPRAALATAPNSPSVSGGLHDLAYRAANGQVYQVLQNPAGNPELQTEDVQITTVVGSTDGINECSTISTSQTQAQAVVSAVSGLAFPVEKVFVSAAFESATRPCFNPNGRGGDGLLCFGEGCNSTDCRCPNGGCDIFSLADLTSLGGSSLRGRLVGSLGPSNPPCSAAGRSTYGFGTDAPAIDPGLCTARPGNGFALQPRRSIVFAYDTPATSEFISGAAGFPIDVGGDSNRCRTAGAVVTGVATKNELGRALVTFTDGRVDFDVNDDRIVERSLPSCQLLSAAQCGAPPPTPVPTPNRPCPEFTTVQPQGSTADAFNAIGGASCGDGGNDSPERSFRFRAAESGCYRIDTLGSGFDTLLYVRRGGETCQGPEIACNDNADGSTLQSEVFVQFEAGDSAVIVVDGSSGARGNFRLGVARVGLSCEGTGPTPTATGTATQPAEGSPTPTPSSTRTPTPTATPGRPLNVWISNGPEGGNVLALAIDPASPQTLYAGTLGGDVFTSTNGGENWSVANSGLPDTTVFALAIDPASPQTLYAGTSGGGVFKSTNGGRTWDAANSGLTSTSVVVLAIDPVSPQTLYAGTFDGVFKSTNGGASWNAANSGLTDTVLTLAINPASPQTLYAGTNVGGVFKSTNGGTSWSAANSGLTGAPIAALVIDPASPQTLYAGMFGDVFKSTNGGGSWSAVNSGLTNQFVTALAIDPASPQTLYAGTNGDGVFKSTNGGESWGAASSDLTDPNVLALAIDPASPQTLYAGTKDSGVFKSTNGGASWSAANSGLTNTYVRALAIDPASPQTLYAGMQGTQGLGVFKSTNGGGSWSAANSGLTNTLVRALAIDPASPQTLYAGTNGNGVLKSTNGGGTWSAINSGLTATFPNALAIDPASPQTLYAGTQGFGVFKSTNGGGSWSAVNSGLTNQFVNALAIDPASPQTLYAGMRDRGVFKSTNGGGSWSAANSGLTNQFVNALAIDPASPQTLYAGTDGGVFKSTNGGENWSEANSGLADTEVRALAIDPASPQTLSAGTFGGGVFKSTNGGGTWSAVNSGLTTKFVDALAIDPASPQTLYAGTGGGGVFRLDQEP